ncbi:MAG: hypothetical protein ACTHMM_17675 [Agriterribacter sp.]
MPIKVKKQYEHEVVGFNNSGKPLGQRSDLHVLYDIAKRGNHAHLLKYFEEVPDEIELEKIKVETFNRKQQQKSAKTK